MSDLISRADAIDAVRKCVVESELLSDWNKAMESAQELLSALPSAEAVQGEWKIDEYGIYHCPFCHAINNTVYKSFWPNCGARMKGGAE